MNIQKTVINVHTYVSCHGYDSLMSLLCRHPQVKCYCFSVSCRYFFQKTLAIIWEGEFGSELLLLYCTVAVASCLGCFCINHDVSAQG